MFSLVAIALVILLQMGAATELSAQVESYQPPKATFDYTKNSPALDAMREEGKKNDCTPIWDIPGVNLKIYGPWHLNISSLTGNDDDYVFLCRYNKHISAYKLVIIASSNINGWEGCPSTTWTGFPIRGSSGLALYKSDSKYHSRDMSHWHTDLGEQGPQGVNPTGPIIDTRKHDAGWVLTCYNRVWYGYFAH